MHKANPTFHYCRKLSQKEWQQSKEWQTLICVVVIKLVLWLGKSLIFPLV